MQRRADNVLRIVGLCAVFLLGAVPCFGGSAAQAPPRGLVVSSILVNPQEYTADGGRYDLFVQAVPGGKTTRLTNHRANPKLRLGGAIREPLFSHNGKRIIFLADYANSDDRRTTMTGAAPYPNTLLNAWEVQLDTRKVSPITNGDLGWNVFGWSPDDRFICATYQSKAASVDQDTPVPYDLYVWNTLTRQGRKLARVPDWIDDAFWSRDGSRIIYQSGPNANLYSISRQGGKSKILLRGKAACFGYSFSPDGRKVAYVDRDTVYVANADGSKPKPAIKPLRAKDFSYWPKPRWSRDGKKLAVYELFQGNGQSTSKLHVYDAIAGRDRVVATLREFSTALAWSKNGQWLIVKTLRAGSAKKPDPKTGWHTFHREGLLAVSIAGGHVVVLKEPDRETKGLDWFETDNP